MRRSYILNLFVGVLASTALADCPPPQPGENDFQRGQVMLRVADYATIGDVVAQLDQSYPGTIIQRASESRAIYLVYVPIGTLECDVLEDLIATMVVTDPNVPDPNRPLTWAELNYESEAAEGSTGSIYISYEQPTAAQLYQAQYAVQMLGVNSATSIATGRGVAVAVLDTGIDALHPALQGAILPGYNFVTDSPITAEVADGVDSDGDQLFDEMFGHGTFVAGLIHLTAPEAKILPIVVLDDDGFGETFQIVQGVYYAIDHGVEVINMSFGTSDESDAIHEALEEARQHGIVVVAAAGNDNRSDPPRMPANSGDAIGVAAVDDLDIRAPFSNFNEDLFLSAPGTTATLANQQADPNRAIFSTVPGGGYATWEGTSVATAFVSGAAALIRSQHPEWSRTSFAAGQTVDRFEETAIDIDPLNPGFEHMLGVGRVDIGAAIAAGPPTPIAGDLDADGDVDLTDLGLLLCDFDGVHSSADLNASGLVDLTDLAVLLGNFSG